MSIFEFDGQQLALMDVQPETPKGQTVLIGFGKVVEAHGVSILVRGARKFDR